MHRTLEDFQQQCTFLLTGSSARKLKRENANLLAGRAIRCEFFPISHQEYDIANNLGPILQWGSLPKSLLTKNDTVKAGYLETYVHTGDLRAELSPAIYRYGILFENLIVNELNRLRSLEFPEVKMYHYRTLNGKEIDLILQKNIATPPIAIEIKSQTAPRPQEVKSLAQFNQDYPEAPRYVICQTPTRYISQGIVFLPFVEGIRVVLEAVRGT